MLHSRDSHLKHLSNLNAAFYFGPYNERNNDLLNNSVSLKFPVKGPLTIKIKDEEDFSPSAMNIVISDTEGDPKKLNKEKLADGNKAVSSYSSSKVNKEFSFSRENSLLMETPVKKRKTESGEEVIGIPRRMIPWKESIAPGSLKKGDKVQRILCGKFLKTVMKKSG